MSFFLSWGSTPHRTDTINTLLKRIALGVESGGGAGPGTGTYSGSGSPEGVVTATTGSSYVDTTAPYDVWYKVSGSGNTGWVMKVE